MTEVARETSVEGVATAILGSLLRAATFSLGYVLIYGATGLKPVAFASDSGEVSTHPADIPALASADLASAEIAMETNSQRVEPLFTSDRSIGANPFRLCQPFTKRGAPIGALILHGEKADGADEQTHFALVTMLATHFASALDAAVTRDSVNQIGSGTCESGRNLETARAALSRASQLSVMEGLAASIAHETNQPLLSIASAAAASLRWLQRPKPDIAEAVANIEDIQAAAGRMKEIIQAVRALAKQAPASVDRIDIDDVICEVLRLVRPELEQASISVATHLTASQHTFVGDRTQLQQLIANLISNATYAMASQVENRRKLTIISAIVDKVGHVTIRDTGPGIPEALTDKIFEPFFTTRSDGMGVGLSISRTIAEQHGGSLSIRHTGATGTEFRFTIPESSL